MTAAPHLCAIDERRAVADAVNGTSVPQVEDRVPVQLLHGAHRPLVEFGLKVSQTERFYAESRRDPEAAS